MSDKELSLQERAYAAGVVAQCKHAGVDPAALIDLSGYGDLTKLAEECESQYVVVMKKLAEGEEKSEDKPKEKSEDKPKEKSEGGDKPAPKPRESVPGAAMRGAGRGAAGGALVGGGLGAAAGLGSGLMHNMNRNVLAPKLDASMLLKLLLAGGLGGAAAGGIGGAMHGGISRAALT